MRKEYRKLPWNSEGSYLERSLKRDKAFELLQGQFKKGSDDRQNPNSDPTSPEVPVNPKSPIVLGGWKKLE